MSRSTLQALICAGLLALSAGSRAHLPDQPAHQIADLGEFKFEKGGSLKNLRMSYVTHGRLNGAKDNGILVQHGFAANHHLFDHLIGPGKALDTDKYFIIATDALGATQTGYEHSSSPSNSGLKMKFPQYNGRDMVRAQHKLLTEKLGIRKLLAVSGISAGADHSVQYAVSYPDFMDGIFPIVGGALWSSQGFFFGSLMLSNLESCEGWQKGEYDVNPKHCGTNALSVLIPYFYTREWWDQHIKSPADYTAWRTSAWGFGYLDVQDARDLWYRAMAWGQGWVGDTPGFDGDVNAALRSIKARTLFLYNPQDAFHMPHHVQSQVQVIPNASAMAIDSVAGHIICCDADPAATKVLGAAIRDFLVGLRSGK